MSKCILLFLLHLRRNFQPKRVESDEAGGVVLVVVLQCGIGSVSIVAISKLPFSLSGKANREWRQKFRYSRGNSPIAFWRNVVIL